MNNETPQDSSRQLKPDFHVNKPSPLSMFFISKWRLMSPEQQQQLAELLKQLSGLPEVTEATGSFLSALRQKAQEIGERLKLTAKVVEKALPVAVMVTLMGEIQKESGEHC